MFNNPRVNTNSMAVEYVSLLGLALLVVANFIVRTSGKNISGAAHVQPAKILHKGDPLF